MSDPAARSSTADQQARSPVLRLATIAVGVAASLLLAASIGSYAARLAWWLDLLTHLRPLLAIGLVACTLLQLCFRRRRLAAAWAAGALLAALPLLPYWIGGQAVAQISPFAKLIHANLGKGDLRIDPFVEWVESEQPAVLSLQEVTPTNLMALQTRLVGYRLVASRPRDDTRGVAMFVANDTPVGVDARVIELLAGFDRPMVEAVFRTQNGREVAFPGFHTTRPTSKVLHGIQRDTMTSAVQWALAQQSMNRDAVLIGDFNCTGQGMLAIQMCQRAQLVDMRRGNGWHGTWPARAPAFCRLPVDGGYATSGVTATSIRVGPDVGSDHRPVAYDLWLTGLSAAETGSARP